MEIKDILKSLRVKNHLTQEQMAEKLGVTRQAVSRWENGVTWPNPEMLKVLSKQFDVSINTLLGSPRTIFCHCCGMPVDETDTVNQESSSTSGLATKTELWKWLHENYTKDFLEGILALIRKAGSFEDAVSEMSIKYAIPADVAAECLNLPFLEASTMDKLYCRREWQKYVLLVKQQEEK